ncbi:MAG TPA: TIGR00730 family Rossman fold protein [Burkholderiaceae bacterium]|nr:TIGR00730 family Rossman fold protein [Burkholderiaceae bacterium]
MSVPLAIAVYCGSRFGDSPAFERAARAIGAAIGAAGDTLVYGGGRVGLMGAVADAALAAGGRVIGVIPQALMDREVGHPGLSELHVVQTMHERKQRMARHADAFVALPGGIGTLEELYEMWSWQQLGYHDKPVALLNVEGYYDALLAFTRVSFERGFVSKAQFEALLVDTDVARLFARVREAAALATAPDDYSKT